MSSSPAGCRRFSSAPRLISSPRGFPVRQRPSGPAGPLGPAAVAGPHGRRVGDSRSAPLQGQRTQFNTETQPHEGLSVCRAPAAGRGDPAHVGPGAGANTRTPGLRSVRWRSVPVRPSPQAELRSGLHSGAKAQGARALRWDAGPGPALRPSTLGAGPGAAGAGGSRAIWRSSGRFREKRLASGTCCGSPGDAPRVGRHTIPSAERPRPQLPHRLPEEAGGAPARTPITASSPDDARASGAHRVGKLRIPAGAGAAPDDTGSPRPGAGSAGLLSGPPPIPYSDRTARLARPTAAQGRADPLTGPPHRASRTPSWTPSWGPPHNITSADRVTNPLMGPPHGDHHAGPSHGTACPATLRHAANGPHRALAPLLSASVTKKAFPRIPRGPPPPIPLASQESRVCS